LDLCMDKFLARNTPKLHSKLKNTHERLMQAEIRTNKHGFMHKNYDFASFLLFIYSTFFFVFFLACKVFDILLLSFPRVFQIISCIQIKKQAKTRRER